MAEEKDIALLADNDIIVEIEVQEAPTVVIETPHTTTAEISGDSALGIVVGALPTLAKEATLLAKVAELKEALNSIDFTAIEQAIQNVEDITAKEATLIQGVEDIIKAVENIDFTDLENSITEVKNAVTNIDFSALAKEDTLTQGISSVESKVEEVGNKIDNIKLPEIDTTELAKEVTLNKVSNKLDNLNVEVDLSGVAKETTLSQGISEVKNAVANIDLSTVAKETTLTQGLSSVESKVEEVGNKIDNIKLPEIDTTELAKQGNNPDATLTAIYKLLIGSNEPSSDIPEGVAERLALILEFFGIKPIEAYEFMTAEEVCSELEEIMTSMDLDLTPEQAKEITNNTLNKG